MSQVSTAAARVVKGYELRESIAFGAAGMVYRAYQPAVRRHVLVRVIPPDLATQPGFLARYDTESLRIARLEHPHILPLYDYWHDETGAYMVARYLPRSLRAALADGPWPLAAGLRLLEQLALALDAAHRAGIVHQGVSPDLVLLDEQDNAYLAGFVMGQMGLSAPPDSPYFAPEQRAGLPAEPATDIYSLGILIYEVLTGVAPARAGEDLPPMRAHTAGLPPALDAVLKTATARLAEHRFGEGRQFVAALRAAAAPMARSQPLVDPLTGRELDILGLMVQGRDNAEIADHLVLSASTVKWYVKQVYSKLDAHSREEAIDRAHALGLAGAVPADVPVAPAPVQAEPVLRGLPAFGLPFIGRERALAEVAGLLSEPGRALISLIAPGGMGKTRLAVEAARAAAVEFPDGVVYVPLASATDVQFPEALLHALGILIAAERPMWEQVMAYCAPRRLLLVLDNFETVLDAALRVAELLSAAPRCRALITSRERLRLEAETVYPVAAMEAPPEQHGLPPITESMQLFIERARRVRFGFAVDDASLREIASICRLVEGMPLALVLAASWAEVLSPAEIAAEIRASGEFLASELTDLPERQRSIRVVFESAWERLNEDERQTFARLSVFHGGFTRGAASVVAGATLRTLAALVTRALIWTDESGRYAIHELLRQFAADRLAAAGEAGALLEAHSQHYLDWAVRMEPEICGPNPAPALNAMDADWHNLRAALLWASEYGRPAWITPAWKTLWLYHDRHARIAAGEALLNEVIQRLRLGPKSGERDTALGLLQTVRASFAALMWDPQRYEMLDEALPLVQDSAYPMALAFWYFVRGYTLPMEAVGDSIRSLQQALDRFRSLNDRWFVASVLLTKTWQDAISGDAEQVSSAIAQSLEVLALTRDLGDVLLQAHSLNILGILEGERGHQAESAAYFTQSLSAARLGGDRKRECNTLNNLALNHLNWGLLDSAQMLLETALAIRRESLPFVFIGYEDLGEVFLRKGEFERARPLFAEAESRFERHAQPVWTQIYLLYRARLAFALGQWGDLHQLVREMQAFAAETGEAHKLHFALATEAWGALAREDGAAARAAEADLRALAEAGDPVIEALAAALGAELRRQSGAAAGAADDLKAALAVVDTGSIEPVAAGWEERFTPLQVRGLLVRALLDAGDLSEARAVALTALDKAYASHAPPFVLAALLACARVEAAAGELERAVEVAALIAASSCAFAADRLQARALLDALGASVASAVITGSAERAGGLDWQAAAADRLAQDLPE